MTLLLRLIVFTVPFFLLAFLFIQRYSFSMMETILLIAVSLLLPWLILELLQRIIYQKSAQETLLKFCDTVETLVRRLSTIETQLKDKKGKGDNDQDIVDDVRILRSLVEEIAKAQKEAPLNDEVVEAEIIEEDAASQKDDPSPAKRQTLTREQLLSLVEGALKHNRIEMLMQCIVSLPQRKTRHFECFSRLRSEDGTVFNPDHFLSLAEEKNLMRVVDNTLLFRCIQMIRATMKKHFDVCFFLNMSHTTLGDRFFIQSLVDFLESNGTITKYLVLEFAAPTFKTMTEPMKNTLRKLQDLGCTFSIDQVTDLDFDIPKLKAMGVHYLKLHSDEVIKILKSPQGAGKLNQFKIIADHNGMDLILSHVESEDTVRELSDLHFDYGQGFLFGTPALSRQF